MTSQERPAGRGQRKDDVLRELRADGALTAAELVERTRLSRPTIISLLRELEEAARLDGCNPWQTFWRVMVPVVKPGLFAVMITTVLWSWNDLLWPLIVTTREQSMPLSVGIATLAGQHSSEFALMMAASVMAMAPIFLLFFSMQRKVIEGLASSGLKG